jgi:sugar phosphate isomerase/epimerase
MNTCVFSKHLQEFGFAELGRRLRGIGVDGVDLTVRPGGHVEPEAAAETLPAAAAALEQEGVAVTMITTAITSADDPHARTVLEAAAKTGVRFYKLGYYGYDGFGTLRSAMAEVKPKLRDLAALSKELGLWAGFHNHSGPYVGACLPHVRELVEDLDPDAIGSYLDVGHAAVEGGFKGWLLGMDDLSGRIRMLALKDLILTADGAARPIDVVPMGEGLVRWDELAGVLRKLADRIGPVSFHGEYGGHTGEEVLAMVAQDIAFFEGVWNKTK